MAEATITSKGQITIPKKIRDELKLHAGDKLYIETDDQGRIRLKKSTLSIKDRAGSLAKYAPAKPVSIEEMNDAIKQEVIKRYKRSL